MNRKIIFIVIILIFSFISLTNGETNFAFRTGGGTSYADFPDDSNSLWIFGIEYQTVFDRFILSTGVDFFKDDSYTSKEEIELYEANFVPLYFNFLFKVNLGRTYSHYYIGGGPMIMVYSLDKSYYYYSEKESHFGIGLLFRNGFNIYLNRYSIFFTELSLNKLLNVEKFNSLSVQLLFGMRFNFYF